MYLPFECWKAVLRATHLPRLLVWATHFMVSLLAAAVSISLCVLSVLPSLTTIISKPPGRSLQQVDCMSSKVARTFSRFALMWLPSL